MNVSDLSARDRILVTAHDLFYRDGIRATGIDSIIALSGVAKLTFYRHFPSKDQVVKEFLEYRHGRWMAWFIDSLGRHGAVAGGGFTPLLAAMDEWFENPLFRGCAFINVTAELGGAQPEILKIAQAHKREMQQVIADLIPDGPGKSGMASAAAMAVDGAIMRAQMEGKAHAKKPDAEKSSALDCLGQVLKALQSQGLPAKAPLE